MFICKVLFFCTFHLSSFLPPFRPYPLAQCPITTTHITHHPSPPRTTPHTPHTHCTTLHSVSIPLWLWAVLSLRSALSKHLKPPSTPLHHNSPQHCTQLHNVVKSSTNLVISTIHTSHNVVQSEITHYILYTFLF